MNIAAKGNNPKTSAQLIQLHRQARVHHADPVSWIDTKLTGKRELNRQDVIDSLIRQYG